MIGALVSFLWFFVSFLCPFCVFLCPFCVLSYSHSFHIILSCTLSSSSPSSSPSPGTKEGPPQWVTLERIQFVGACNPPTDPGRVVLSSRFLRHAPLLFVDYPAPDSLKQIYGTLNRGLMKLQPNLRAHSGPLTEAMVAMYSRNQQHFTPDKQPHYVYSPRELSRSVRAIYEAISNQSDLTLEELVRVWLHEGYVTLCVDSVCGTCVWYMLDVRVPVGRRVLVALGVSSSVSPKT